MADGVESLGQVYHDCASDLASSRADFQSSTHFNSTFCVQWFGQKPDCAVFKSLLGSRNSTSWLATRDSKTLASTGSRMEIGLRLLRSFLPPGLGTGLMFASFHSDGN